MNFPKLHGNNSSRKVSYEQEIPEQDNLILGRFGDCYGVNSTHEQHWANISYWRHPGI